MENKAATELAVKMPTVEPAYMQLIKADQEQNRERATNLPILDDAAKKEIADATKYSGYFSNPITKEFMKSYILCKLEFPTTLSCLAQSITELNVRIENLFSDAYTHSKAQIEVRQKLTEVKKAKKKIIEAGDDEIAREEAQNELDMAMLEATNKQANLQKIELQAMARFKEAKEWKSCVEDFMKEGGYESLDQVPWDTVRMGEMAAKTELWGKLHAKGLLEITPSKFNVIHDHVERFNKGFQEAKLEMEQIEHMQKLAAQMQQNTPKLGQQN